jgi:hypothetical protein
MNVIKQEEGYGVNITATRREFLEMYKVLHETRGEKGVKYAMIVLKNCDVIKKELDFLEEKAAPTEAFIELSRKAQELMQAENEEGLKAMEAEHMDEINARKQQIADVNIELDKEVTLELKMINEKLLPESLSADQIETLIKIIN